jgi:DNA adenine methylase
MKPFLRWAGSKVQLLPAIQQYWRPTYRRYVEPFCGSACLFFSIQPQAALLSDLNEELICTLKQVQISADVVVECLYRIKTDEETYYKVRAIDPCSLSPNERAARFIYLNTLCFNGLYRTNLAGQFNVPYGSRTRKSRLNPNTLRDAARLLKSAVLENSDFESVINQTMDGDFLYLDPPYATGSRRIFSQYGKDIFSEKDLVRLVASLHKAVDRGVRFVLSYADVPEIAAFRRQWPSIEVTARRNIAGFSDSRRQANEVLVTNCG